MPKSRGRKGARKSPKVQRYAKAGQRQANAPFKMANKEWAPTPRRALVGGCVVKGYRFYPAGDGFRRTLNAGPPNEAWTNAWYTYKENKDKGWRYCEGFAKLPNGLMTTAWVLDNFGNVVECTPGVNAEWYQGFVLIEDNAMMSPPDAPWDEDLPRPQTAARGTDEFLDGERQLESVSRLTGEGWLGSMMETCIAALQDAYNVEYAVGVFHAIAEITDMDATKRFGTATPDVLEDDAELAKVAEFYPVSDEAVEGDNRAPNFKIADKNLNFWNLP